MTKVKTNSITLDINKNYAHDNYSQEPFAPRNYNYNNCRA